MFKQEFYVCFYIDREHPDNSYIIGACNELDSAVKRLVSSAGYSTTSSGELIQYGRYQEEYESYKELYDKVYSSMELLDDDIDLYRIKKVIVQ